MLTANRLRDGEVVWWNDGTWVEKLAQGQILAEAAIAEAALTRATADVEANIVVNPYLFEVRMEGERIVPVKEREIIRAGGPSIHADLGKQAAHV